MNRFNLKFQNGQVSFRAGGKYVPAVLVLTSDESFIVAIVDGDTSYKIDEIYNYTTLNLSIGGKAS